MHTFSWEAWHIIAASSFEQDLRSSRCMWPFNTEAGKRHLSAHFEPEGACQGLSCWTSSPEVYLHGSFVQFGSKASQKATKGFVNYCTLCRRALSLQLASKHKQHITSAPLIVLAVLCRASVKSALRESSVSPDRIDQLDGRVPVEKLDRSCDHNAALKFQKGSHAFQQVTPPTDMFATELVAEHSDVTKTSTGIPDKLLSSRRIVATRPLAQVTPNQFVLFGAEHTVPVHAAGPDVRISCKEKRHTVHSINHAPLSAGLYRLDAWQSKSCASPDCQG